MVDAQSLVGVWRLISYRRESLDGAPSYPNGTDPVGYFFFGRSGYFNVSIMQRERKSWASEDRNEATAEELSASRGYTNYSGRWKLEGDILTSHVEVCYLPNWVGGDQLRRVKLEGDTLTLTNEPMLARGVTTRAVVVWERVG